MLRPRARHRDGASSPQVQGGRAQAGVSPGNGGRLPRRRRFHHPYFGGQVGIESPPHVADQETDVVAAVAVDGVLQLVPRRTVVVAVQDAEILDDLGDDSALRTTADLGRGFLHRGHVVGVVPPGRGLGVPCGRRAGARIAGGRQANGGWTAQLMAAGGTLAEPGFERGGAHQAAGEAAEDHAEIGGLEPIDERPGQRLGGMLANRGGEQGAIGDEPADDADDTADGAGFGGGDGGGGGGRGLGGGSGLCRGRGGHGGASVGPTGIGLEGRDDGKGEGGRHEGNKSTYRGRCQMNFFIGAWAKPRA